MDQPGSNYRVARSPTATNRWLMVVLVVVVGFGAYRVGGNNRVLDYAQLQSQLSLANDELLSLRVNVVSLGTEVAALRQRGELDQQQRSNVAAELIRLRHQLTDARRELELYSGLGDQISAEGGVAVHLFEISTAATEGEYRYDLVLAQTLTATDRATGTVDIGFADVEKMTQVAEHDFEFQVFEKFSGPILRPAAGVVEDVKVQLKINVRGEAEAIYEYHWRELSGAEQVDEGS